MRISRELDDLIDDSIEDDYKISSKEKEILLKKAISEGIDKNEFEIYLNARLQKARRNAGKEGGLIAILSKFFTNTPKKLGLYILAVLYFILMGCYFLFKEDLESLSKPKNYDRLVESLAAKNKFSDAMDAASKANNPSNAKLKVLQAEANYWIGLKDFDRAFLKINEMKSIESKFLDLEEDKLNKAISESYLILVSACCTSSQYDKANSFINLMPEKLKIGYRNEYISTDESKTKYNGIKEGLTSTNEEIEPFKGLGENYKIISYTYPKKDARNILIENRDQPKNK